jgi:tetratricopeptide (TPR) repeat protein
VSARAHNRLHGPEFTRPAYRSDLEPIPLREARAPLIEVPANPNPAHDSQPERIVRKPPVAAPMSPAEAVDLEQQSEELPVELPVEETRVASARTANPLALVNIPSILAHDATLSTADSLDPADSPCVSAHAAAAPIDDPPEQANVPLVSASEEPVLVTPVDVLPEYEIDDRLSELEPVAIEQSSSSMTEPQVEPRSAIECPSVEPFILGEQPVSVPAAPLFRDDPGDEQPRRHVAPSPAKSTEWPSAKDILAVHRAVPARQVAANTGKPATKKINRSTLMPTLEREPSHWTPPIALAGPVAVIFMLAAGFLGCTLSWSWAQDSYTAAIVTDRLLTSNRAVQAIPLPDSVQPPAGAWLTSTPGHLATWAIFLGHGRAEENQSSGEAVALLERALAASPINSQARLALAQLEPADSAKSVPLRSLGLSRDAVTLAWTARRLLTAGKKDDALALFGRALSFAVPDKSSRHRLPRFSEDPGVPRYLLPGEETVREIVVEFVSQNVWTFEEWSRVLPESPIVLLATARLLRERGRSEAETVLDRMLKQELPLSPGKTGAVALAACAEALALRSRFTESDQLYRQAIDLIDDPTVRRSWWFNLADIAYRSDDDVQRQAALRSASAVAFSDDITRRATDIQRTTLTRSTGVKAN